MQLYKKSSMTIVSADKIILNLFPICYISLKKRKYRELLKQEKNYAIKISEAKVFWKILNVLNNKVKRAYALASFLLKKDTTQNTLNEQPEIKQKEWI